MPEPRSTSIRDHLLITLAAMLAITPLLLHGTSCGHDANFHFTNWMEVADQWRHGTLRPLWSYSSAWNAGEPRFIFYPPFSWCLGALLSFVLPWTALPTAYVLTALVLAGFSMRRLLRQFVSEPVALLGSCLYLANPYMLFVAFERAADAELLAAAWLPLLLAALLRRRTAPGPLAIATALLWLTNAPAAVVGSYTVLIVGAVRLGMVWHKTTAARPLLSEAARIAGGYLLGVFMADVYLLPAVVQRSLIQMSMAMIAGMRPPDNFLFGQTGEPLHDAVLHTASVLAAATVVIGLLAAGAVLSSLQRHAFSLPGTMHRRHAALIIAALTVAIAFLLTRFSGTVWAHAPELGLLQFPWRFLAVQSAATALLVSLALPGRWTSRTAIALALPMVVGFAYISHHSFAQACDSSDEPRTQRAAYLDGRGVEATDEYTPAAADNDALRDGFPEAWMAASENSGPAAAPVPRILKRKHATPLVLETPLMASPMYLVVRLRAYRGWTVLVDGSSSAAQSGRDDGLVDLALGPGAHRVELRQQWTWDEWAGFMISMGAVGICGSVVRCESRVQRYSTTATL